MPKDDVRRAQLRVKLIEHLEGALACADETQESEAGYLIEQALDWIRSKNLPPLDPRS